jgi:predicted ferric reductase
VSEKLLVSDKSATGILPCLAMLLREDTNENDQQVELFYQRRNLKPGFPSKDRSLSILRNAKK